MVEETLNIVDPPAVDREALYRHMQSRMLASEKPWMRGTGSTVESLNQDIHEILCHKPVRVVCAEPPPDLGNYEQIAPSKYLSAIAKFRRPARGHKAKCAE